MLYYIHGQVGSLIRKLRKVLFYAVLVAMMMELVWASSSVG